MVAGDLRPPLRIGDWLLDPSTDTISQADEVQKLEPRTTRLLLLLADSPGTVISVDKMLTEVWPGVVVGPASVYQAVSRLRRLLRDTDPDPTYIATVPRKGYRLVAPVRGVEPAQPLAAPASAPPHRWRRTAAFAVVSLALLGLVFLGWRQFAARPPAESASIVVLPFIDMTAEKHDQAFCDGLTEELSNWLAQIPTLRVVARTSAFAYRGKDIDVRTIGRELGTSHVLEGSLRRGEGTLRVTAQLVNTRDGYHVWSATFDRPMEDVIKVQEEIARSVADNLEIRLTERTTQRFAARGEGTPQAYQLYLLARHHQQQLTRDSNNRAIELYRQALELDDHFALAYAALAHAYINQSYLNGLTIDDVAQKAEPLLAAGIRLNPDLPELYTARGGLRSDQGRYDEALRDLRHAIELNPNDSQALAEMGYVLITNGRPREGLQSYDAAASIDPLDFNLHARRCIALTDMARFDEADMACRQARTLAPGASWAFVATSWLDWARGRIDRSLEWNALALKASPDEVDLYDDRANLLLTLGLPKAARETLERARVATGNEERAAIRLAQVSFYEGGAPMLLAHLQAGDFDASTKADTLLLAARQHLLLQDAAAAKRLLDRAFTAADLGRDTLDHPWYERQGDSNELVLAMAELGTNERDSAGKRLNALLRKLDRLEQSGIERYGVYKLRAEVLALQGDTAAAMTALNHAAQLGWRAATEATHDPAFASLQSRNDFRLLLGRVQADDQRMQANIAPLN